MPRAIVQSVTHAHLSGDSDPMGKEVTVAVSNRPLSLEHTRLASRRDCLTEGECHRVFKCHREAKGKRRPAAFSLAVAFQCPLLTELCICPIAMKC